MHPVIVSLTAEPLVIMVTNYINAVMKEGLWSICSHPDVPTEQEFTHNCEIFQCEHTKDALLAAAGCRDAWLRCAPIVHVVNDGSSTP